jgi:hypothetical protein
MNKNPFDYSGSSLWTTDAKLKSINLGKINGKKRRDQIKRTEIPDFHPLQSRKNKK